MPFIAKFLNKTAALRNRHSSRRAFILANGPSLLRHDLSKLKDEIVIGMNASTMLERDFGFRTDYYVVSDLRFIRHPEKRKWATSELTDTTIRVLRRELLDDDQPELREPTHYVHALGRDGFSRNLLSGFFFGCTTTMLAIQLSYFLGCRKVYLLGCDLRYPVESPRFYHERDPQIEDGFTSVQLMNIANASRAFESDGRSLYGCSKDSFLRPYLPFASYDALF